MGIIKFRIEKFSAYGLNAFRNFMSAPDCDCGCGGIMLDDNDEVFGFMNAMLQEHDCECSAIFAIDYDGAMYAGVLEPECEEDSIHIMGIPNTNMDFFADIDAEFRLCCYGLMIEIEPGVWKIVEE